MMPEEINRIVTDHTSDLLFAPTETAINNLKNEGLNDIALNVGDIMYDSVLYYQKKIISMLFVYEQHLPAKFYLATIHRPQNTDNIDNLKSIFDAFSQLKYPVIFPLHPRTRKIIQHNEFKISNVIIIDPIGYLQMLDLLSKCEKVLTDSGGLQKEAFFSNKQCLTLRTETEWIETLNYNWNVIVGADKDNIIQAINLPECNKQEDHFGNGNSAELIIEAIINSKDASKYKKR